MEKLAVLQFGDPAISGFGGGGHFTGLGLQGLPEFLLLDRPDGSLGASWPPFGKKPISA